MEVTLTFSEAVTVDTTGGTPSIGLDLGGTESRRAPYLRGSGTTALVFGYTLTATDGSHTSLLVPIDSLALNGGTIDKARRLTAGSNLAWEVTMTPSQSGDITIRLPARACTETNAVCAGGRALEQAVSATVRGVVVPFTASFSGVPAEHDGTTAFDIRFHLSAEPASLSYLTVQNGLFDVTGGSIEKASRLVAGKNNGWTLRMAPSGLGDVTLRVNGTTACNTAPGVCTADGRKLPGGLSVSSAGPAVLSVADAEVEEGADATLDFVVTLSKARFATTTVQYATSDGSATAGADYTAQSGTLTFGQLETTKIVSVPVLDDSHDEGSETLTLTLSNASDNVRLGETTATGTITNSDPLPRALMARFGRTAAVHVVEHVEERMQAPREPGFRGRFAGRELRRGMERDVALSFVSQFGGAAGVNGTGTGAYGAMAGSPAGGTASVGIPGHAGGTPMAAVAGPMGAGPGLGGASLMGGPSSPEGGGLLQMGLGAGDVLTGSTFSLNRETRQGGILSFWSRGAQSHFSGRDGALSLGGDVRTTMFGVDYAKGPLVTGLSMSHSRGLGEYSGVTGGQVASAVTGLYPWLGYKATDRITVWGVAGYGAGGLLLTPDGGPALESGLSMAMAAAGTRGELFAGGAGGFELAFKADALWVGTSIDGVGRRGGAPGGDRGGGDPVPDGAGGLAGLHARRQAVAQAERRGRTAARRRGRRDRGRHGRRRRAGGVGRVDRADGRRAGADAGDAPGRRVQGAGHGAVSELQPNAVDAAGLRGAGGAVVGRSGGERGRGDVGTRDDGGHGARRPRVGQPASMARSATGCRWGAASWGRRESASRPRSTGETIGWATASGCWPKRIWTSSWESTRSGGKLRLPTALTTACSGGPRCAGKRGSKGERGAANARFPCQNRPLPECPALSERHRFRPSLLWRRYRAAGVSWPAPASVARAGAGTDALSSGWRRNVATAGALPERRGGIRCCAMPLSLSSGTGLRCTAFLLSRPSRLVAGRRRR